LVSLLISFLLFLSCLGLRRLGLLQALELKVYDCWLNWQPHDDSFASAIVLVGLTEEDIRSTLGRRYPLTDEQMARLLGAILAGSPSAVGVDIYRDLPVEPGSAGLNQVFREHKNVVAISLVGHNEAERVPPPPILAGTEQVGANDLVFDDDGTVRRGLLQLDDGKNLYFTLGLRLALIHLGYQKDGEVKVPPDPENEDLMRLGGTTLRPFQKNDGGYVNADDGGYQILLDYKGPREFKTFSITEVLQGIAKPEDFRDRIVIVGTRTSSVKDFIDTPLQKHEFAFKVHAIVADQLLRAARRGSRAAASLPDWQEEIWMLFLGVLGSMLGLGVRSPAPFAAGAAGGGLLLGFGTYGAFLKGLWLPFLPPALAWFTAAALVTSYISYLERQERAVLMRLFSRHVSPDVAETIWRHRDQFLEGGRLRAKKVTATVLFSDLKGFTSVSEAMDPGALMDWLNEYMESMARVITEHGGMINKYQGDGIMAVFGVPVPRQSEKEVGRDAVNAVICALVMRGQLSRLHEKWKVRGLPAVAMRVGIFTGPLVAGSLGSSERLEYTVIGDTVNTASRLESFDKELMDADIAANHCRVLIGGSTQSLLDGRFKTRLVGEMALKGKKEPVIIYGVIGRIEAAEAVTLKEAEA
jgi:adenylate cyclase